MNPNHNPMSDFKPVFHEIRAQIKSYAAFSKAWKQVRKLKPGETMEARVAARTARQDALASRPQPPQIHVILDEAVLHRQVGGPAVTCQQLAALAETTTWPNVTLQVIPFTAGANAGMDGHFVILAFPDPEDPPVAYVEGLMGDVYVEAAEEVDRFTLAWTHLVTQALHPAGSAAMIRTLGAAMTTAQDTILTRPWRKSSRSTGGQDCIEVAQTQESCLVRDSKNPDGARLAVRPQTWAAFIRDIKHGAYRS